MKFSFIKFRFSPHSEDYANKNFVENKLGDIANSKPIGER